MQFGVASPAAGLDRLDQLLLGLGHVARPVGREVLAKRLDVAGLVLPGKPLELVENAMRQGLELFGRLGLSILRSLVKAEAADPDLESCVLLELAQRGKRIEAGINFVAQKLELAARKVRLGIPEQSVFGGKLRNQLGLKPIELATKLAVLIGCRTELAPGFLYLAADLLQLRCGSVAWSAQSRLATQRSVARHRLLTPAMICTRQVFGPGP